MGRVGPARVSLLTYFMSFLARGPRRPTLDLRVELRPVTGTFGRCVEEIRQTEWRAVADNRPSLGGRHAAPASQVEVIQILG